MFSVRFNLFFKELMKNEGWIADDALDLGGHTVVGITKKFFPLYHDIVMNMVKARYSEEKIHMFIKLFYYIHFYNPLYDEIHDSSLAFKLFDFGVNASVRRSVKFLQRTNNLNNVEQIKIDGGFGPTTLRVVNSFGSPHSILKETDFYHSYVKSLGKYYKSLWNFFRFGKGWLKRLNRVFNKTKDLS